MRTAQRIVALMLACIAGCGGTTGGGVASTSRAASSNTPPDWTVEARAIAELFPATASSAAYDPFLQHMGQHPRGLIDVVASNGRIEARESE